MKKLTLVYLLFAGLISNAQITISNNDMPSAGDTIRTSIGLNTDAFDFAATGENFSWDFSALNPMAQRVDTFLTVTQTPVAFWPFFIGSANLVAPFNPAQLLTGLPDAEAYRFLQNNNSSFTDVGYGVVVDGAPLPLKYADADEIYQFPMTYGQAFESTANLEIGVPEFGYLLVDRARQNEVDGWGTITTPFGTFDVLRYKSVVSEYDSIYVESTGEGNAIQRDYTEYHWLANGTGLPVLLVQMDAAIGNTVIYLDSARMVNVGLAEQNLPDHSLKVFPNPVRTSLNIAIESADPLLASMKIFDLHNRCIYRNQQLQINQGLNTFTFFTGDLHLKPGSYLIVIQGEKLLKRAMVIVTE